MGRLGRAPLLISAQGATNTDSLTLLSLPNISDVYILKSRGPYDVFRVFLWGKDAQAVCFGNGSKVSGHAQALEGVCAVPASC